MRVKNQETEEAIREKINKMFIVVKIDPKAVTPMIATPGSAGYDLCAIQKSVVPAWGRLLVRTGLKMQIPVGMYGRIASKSGLALRHSIHIGAGVIDSDYRGEVMVLMFNLSNKDYIAEEGSKIAQLILERVATPHVEVHDNLIETQRGEGGFGSTNIDVGPAKSEEPTNEESDEDWSGSDLSLAEVARRSQNNERFKANQINLEGAVKQWANVNLPEEPTAEVNIQRMRNFLKSCRRQHNILREKHGKTVKNFQFYRNRLKITQVKFSALGESMKKIGMKYKLAEKRFEEWKREMNKAQLQNFGGVVDN